LAETSHPFMTDTENELDQPKENRTDFSGLINKVKNYLKEYYQPVFEAKDADIHFTTEEIYRQLLKLVPNTEIFSAADVSVWLHEAGFTFADFGELRFEWLMKKV
jgi:hypothetical protein